MSDRRADVLRRLKVGHRPAVVDWLRDNVFVPRSLSPTGYGPFRIDARPYMAPILACWHPESGVKDCVVSGATQLLKTFILCLGSAYRIANDPVPELIVVPSADFGKKEIGEKKLHPLIRENPALAAMMPENHDEFRLDAMNMRGAPINIVGTNSPLQLSGRTVGIVAQDEVCKQEHHESADAPEAHPSILADERTKDMRPNHFHYKSSSPNTEMHPFWGEYEKGDQTHFAVPCPNCRQYFCFEFTHDPAAGYRSLVCDREKARDASGWWHEDLVRSTAYYVCPHCAFPIRDEHKPAMIAAFEQDRRNAAASPSFRSFRIPSFYSPKLSFGDILWEFLSSQQTGLGALNLQNFYNSWLALPWNAADKEVKENHVLKLRAEGDLAYEKGTIPKKPRMLMLAADPGETSGTHWMCCALCEGDEIFVIDWGVCLAIEDLNQVRKEVHYRLRVTDQMLAPTRGLCDSGHLPARVYDMCRISGAFWLPTRGSDATTGHWSETPVRTHPGLALYTFVDHTIKNELYGRRIADLAPPRVYLPSDASPELVAQLSGQKLINNRWKKLPRDHWGDCLKQALLAQWIMATAQSYGGG